MAILAERQPSRPVALYQGLARPVVSVSGASVCEGAASACPQSVEHNALMKIIAVIVLVLTSYTDCDYGMRCDGITTSGEQTYDGVAACGPEYEFGTVFVVPVLGLEVTCLDRGGSIGNGNLDIWMQERGDALEFGVQRATVIIVKRDDDEHLAARRGHRPSSRAIGRRTF